MLTTVVAVKKNLENPTIYGEQQIYQSESVQYKIHSGFVALSPSTPLKIKPSYYAITKLHSRLSESLLKHFSDMHQGEGMINNFYIKKDLFLLC